MAVGTAGMIGVGRPFTGETEFDFACCDDPVATRGALEPVATSGAENCFFAVLAAEAYDGAEALAEALGAGIGVCGFAVEVICVKIEQSRRVLRDAEAGIVSSQTCVRYSCRGSSSFARCK